MNDWEPEDGDDVRRSSLQSSDNRLVTSKIYKLATSSPNVCDSYNFVWQNHAPPKVKFFAWLLLQNRSNAATT